MTENQIKSARRLMKKMHADPVMEARRISAVRLARTGVPRPTDVRKKISESNLGKPKSDITRKKMSEAKKGLSTWNKGIKTGPLSFETRAKMKGRKVWNTGIKTGKPGPWAGKKRGPHSQEWNAKISAAHLANPKAKNMLEISLQIVGTA